MAEGLRKLNYERDESKHVYQKNKISKTQTKYNPQHTKVTKIMAILS